MASEAARTTAEKTGIASELTVRYAEPADRDAAVSLLRRAYGERPPDERMWEWLFLRNPAADAGFFYLLAEDGERLVGQYPSVPVRMQHDGKQVVGLLCVHTATDPDYQGRGIVSWLARRLYAERGDEAHVVFGFPNRPIGPIRYGRLEWVELRPTPLLIRPVTGLGAVAARWRSWARPLGAAGDLALRGLRAANHGVARASSTARGRRIEPLERFGGWADRLWEELSPALGTCVIRDADYLNWRFVDAPFSYQRLVLVGDQGPEGFAVVGQARRRGLDLDVLMELMVPAQDSTGARLLLDRVVGDATARRAAAIVAVATPRHPHFRCLRQAGFARVPSEVHSDLSFGVRTINWDARPHQLYHLDDWHLSGADLDFI